VEAARIPTVDNSVITQVTISIGVTCRFPVKDDAAEAFISQADANLYTAKETGRNRVCSGKPD
jgi:diguanylate cyclase (GGDEF)-like protein